VEVLGAALRTAGQGGALFTTAAALGGFASLDGISNMQLHQKKQGYSGYR
jgi:hypothetical protein